MHNFTYGIARKNVPDKAIPSMEYMAKSECISNFPEYIKYWREKTLANELILDRLTFKKGKYGI